MIAFCGGFRQVEWKFCGVKSPNALQAVQPAESTVLPE